MDAGTKHAVVHDGFDAETFAEAREAFPRLDTALSGQGDTLATAPALFQDAFLSFYQRAPRLVDADSMDDAYAPNHGIMAEVMGTREHANLRNAGTIGSDLTSAIATASVMETVIGAIPAGERKRMDDLARLTEEARLLLAGADALDDMADEFQAPGLAEQATDMRERGHEKQKIAEEIAQRLADSAQERNDTVRRVARSALEEAQKEIEALGQAVEAFGGMPGSGAGNGRGGATAKDKIAIARRLRGNPKLQQLAAMVGRYMRLALAMQRAKVENQPSEVSAVKRGNDLAHILPSELALLGDPDLEDLFSLRFAESQLLQYEVHANEKLGRGPLIVATDESGSMTGGMGGGATRDLWAKAVALALLAVARRQRRDFAWLHFGSQSEFKVNHFPKGEAGPAAVIGAADHFFNGGTDYSRWMEHALKLVESSKYDRADVVLLSDGEASVDKLAARWNAARAARGMRAYSVLIGAEPRREPVPPDPNTASLAAMVDYHYKGGNQAGATLASISDRVFTIGQLAGEGKILEALFSV